MRICSTGAAAFSTYAGSGGHHGAPHVRKTGLRTGAMVPRAWKQDVPGGSARAVLPGRVWLPYADALAVGDGVQLWPRILADVESGTLRSKLHCDCYGK